MIRTIITDDDAGMRLLLRKAIEKHGGFEILAECENGESCVKVFSEMKPDMVFLDVEMPVKDGITAAREISEIAPDTMMVFVTAHEGYREDAFSLYAVDYLVKPFDISRMNTTLDRIIRWHGDRTGAAEEKGPEIKRPVLKKMMIKGREESQLIDIDEIILIKREDRQSVICLTDGTEILTREGMGDLEERLPRERFFRTHKSYIVNLDYVSTIYPYGRWTYITRLKGTKQDVLITREKYEELEQMTF